MNSQTHLGLKDSKPELRPTLDTESPPRMDVRAHNNPLDTETPPRIDVRALNNLLDTESPPRKELRLLLDHHSTRPKEEIS